MYCVAHAERDPVARGTPRGLPGTGPVRALPAGDDLWLVVADAPMPAYGAQAIEAGLKDLAWVSERAMAHEAVIEHFMARATVVPMKLFTLFSSDARAIAHVARAAGSLARVVSRVAGCQEWGVRLAFHADRARREHEGRTRAAASTAASGTSFLKLKSEAQRAVRDASARAREEADALFGQLSGRARDVRRQPTADVPGANVVLDAAFLVETSAAAKFREVLGAARDRLAGAGLEATLTGPWPPYNFVAERS